jgi:hypothetical protein
MPRSRGQSRVPIEASTRCSAVQRERESVRDRPTAPRPPRPSSSTHFRSSAALATLGRRRGRKEPSGGQSGRKRRCEQHPLEAPRPRWAGAPIFVGPVAHIERSTRSRRPVEVKRSTGGDSDHRTSPVPNAQRGTVARDVAASPRRSIGRERRIDHRPQTAPGQTAPRISAEHRELIVAMGRDVERPCALATHRAAAQRVRQHCCARGPGQRRQW